MGIREQIVKLLKQQPFQPFRLILSNGNVHEIRNPETALVSPYYVIVGKPDLDLPGPAIVDSTMVAMIHIVEIESIAKKSKPPK